MAEIYPYAAAAAVMGVTIGTMIGFFYLLLRYKVKGDGFTRTDLVNSPKPLSGQEIAKMMIALPGSQSGSGFSRGFEGIFHRRPDIKGPRCQDPAASDQ